MFCSELKHTCACNPESRIWETEHSTPTESSPHDPLNHLSPSNHSCALVKIIHLFPLICKKKYSQSHYKFSFVSDVSLNTKHAFIHIYSFTSQENVNQQSWHPEQERVGEGGREGKRETNIKYYRHTLTHGSVSQSMESEHELKHLVLTFLWTPVFRFSW